MYKTILITGGNGFTGKKVVKKLLQLKYKIVLLTQNKRSTSFSQNQGVYVESYDIDNLDFSHIFNKYLIDIILHMSAETRKTCDYKDVVDLNIRFPISLLSCALKHKVKCFVNTDTTIYNNEINSYSLSKKQFSEWLSLNNQGINIINLKIDNIYGKDNNNKRFVSMVIDSLMNNNKYIGLTSGEQKRNFIYIDDFVDLIIRIVHKAPKIGNGYHEYGAGSNEQISIKSLVILISDILGKQQSTLHFEPIDFTVEDDTESCSKIDISNTIKDFNWRPETNLSKGLKEVIRHYIEKQ